MDNKTDLRIWAKSLRKTLNISAKSLIIVDKIRSLVCYQNAKNVMLFYPKIYEVDLRSLLDDNKNFYLPRVSGDELLVCPYEKNDKLNVSSLNIYEPSSNPIKPELLDLLIVPALAVDKMSYRLGYGGGFYDRFLARYKVKSIVPIFKELIVEELPVESFDFPVDIVVSD